MNIDWSKDEEARIPYAINFLKAVLPTFDELLEFMESHKYWLPLQDNVINNFLTYNLNWWDFYEDANGQQFRRPGGRGDDHVLMMLPETLYQEDQELRRKKRNGKASAGIRQEE